MKQLSKATNNQIDQATISIFRSNFAPYV